MRSLRKLARFLVLAGEIGNHKLPSDSITIHLFQRGAQYRAFAGEETAGHTSADSDGFHIGLAIDRPKFTTQILFHEIVHLLLVETEVSLPAWYHEGYAEFLATAILRRGVATVGRILPDRAKRLRHRKSNGLTDLFEIRSPATLNAPLRLAYYDEAWAFVHFALASGEFHSWEPKLRRFVELLAEGRNPDAAFSAAFGETMEQVLPFYLEHRARIAKQSWVIYRHYLIPEIEHEVSFRAVAPVEVNRSLAEHALSISQFGTAIRHYDETLKAVPGDSRALLGRSIAFASVSNFDAAQRSVAAIDPSLPQAAQARGLVELHRYCRFKTAPSISGSDSPHNVDYGCVGTGDPVAESHLLAAFQHLQAAVESEPDCGHCWTGIALFHARHPDGDPVEGLAAASRAGPRVDDGIVRAELLIRLERVGEAAALIERVIATSHDERIARAARALLKQIEPHREESDAAVSDEAL